MMNRGGPVTEPGKAIVRQNALRHGLRASEKILIETLEGTEKRAFHDLREQLWEEYRPVGTVEHLLVDKIALCNVRVARLLIAEQVVVDKLMQPPQTGYRSIDSEHYLNLERLGRYSSHIEKTLRQAIQDLFAVQMLRKHDACGHGPISDAEPIDSAEASAQLTRQNPPEGA